MNVKRVSSEIDTKQGRYQYPFTDVFSMDRCKKEALQQYMKGLQDVSVEGTGWDTREDQTACQSAIESWVADLKKAEVSRN